MDFKITRSLAALLALVAITGCDNPQPPAVKSDPPQIDAADTIYVGGDIVTINDQQPSAGALAVKDGKILAVGGRAEIEKASKGASTQVIDLGGKTLMPSFIDAHSHYINALSVANQARLYAPDHGLRLRRHRHAQRTPAQP